jgi:hypothetical protein
LNRFSAVFLENYKGLSDNNDTTIAVPSTSSATGSCIISSNLSLSPPPDPEVSADQTENVRKPFEFSNDPALWTVNDDGLRDFIARSGIKQNDETDFCKSERQYSNHKRSLPKTVFSKNLQIVRL